MRTKKSPRQQRRENEENLRLFGKKAIRLVLVSTSWDGKRRLVTKGVFADRAQAKAEERRLESFVGPRARAEGDYRVCGVVQYAKLEMEIKAEQASRRKKGAEQAKRTIAKQGGRRFITCPTCDAKSKKLFSEMGGLQTRRCRNGHDFEVDTFGGFPHHARRVEHTDRPLYVGPESYNDYVYGRFKNNPTGK